MTTCSKGRSRSSPAHRAASAARSRWSSRAQGATVVGTATTEPARRRSPTRSRRMRGCSGAVLDVNDARRGRRAHRRDRARSTAALHVLVNNAGITRDNARDAHEGRRLGRGHRHQPASAVFRLSRAVHARHDEGSATAASSTSPRWSARPAMPGQANYAAAKAGVAGMTQVAGARARQPQHHGQLRRAGLHRHRHDARLPEAQQDGAAGADPARPPRRSRRTSPHAVAFLASPRAGYVTGHRRCTSTAACTWPEAAVGMPHVRRRRRMLRRTARIHAFLANPLEENHERYRSTCQENHRRAARRATKPTSRTKSRSSTTSAPIRSTRSSW